MTSEEQSKDRDQILHVAAVMHEQEAQTDAEDAVLRFNVHKVDDMATLNWMALMRRTYAEAAREICLRLPPTHERLMALTKIEEAMFWTSAAAARANGTPNGFGDVPK